VSEIEKVIVDPKPRPKETTIFVVSDVQANQLIRRILKGAHARYSHAPWLSNLARRAYYQFAVNKALEITTGSIVVYRRAYYDWYEKRYEWKDRADVWVFPASTALHSHFNKGAPKRWRAIHKMRLKP